MNFITTLTDKKQKTYDERVREALRALFAVIHRRDTLSEAGFARKLERHAHGKSSIAKLCLSEVISESSFWR